jgi:hypothetical protein
VLKFLSRDESLMVYLWQFSYLLWDFGQYLCISVSACSNSGIESLGIKHC